MLPRHNRSIESQHSIRSQYLASETDETTDEELVKQVNELKHSVRLLRLENEVLEKTLARVDPSLLVGLQQTLDVAVRMRNQSIMSGNQLGSFTKSSSKIFQEFGTLGSPSRVLTSPSKMLASSSRISTRKVESSGRMTSTVLIGSGPKVNVLEKTEIVATEMEMIKKSLEKVKKKAAKQHALLKAQLEETALRMADVEKAVNMFKTEVIIEGWDKIAQRIPAEIWVRFMMEYDKITDAVIGKLRLRTSTLNSQYSKFKGQIKAKAELSESLRPVDFEELKILNSESIKLIDYKIQQLVELKQMTGEANLNLTIHKKALVEQDNYLSSVQKTIKDREVQTVALDKERDTIQEQADALALQLDEVRKVRQAYAVPDVMDYVHVKSELTDLKHCIKVLENRAHIFQIALASINRKLRVLVMEE